MAIFDEKRAKFSHKKVRVAKKKSPPYDLKNFYDFEIFSLRGFEKCQYCKCSPIFDSNLNQPTVPSSHLVTRHSQTRHFEKPRFPCFELQKSDKIAYIYCVINEFNPTFEVQKIGNEAFQNASFGNALFPNKSNNCLWTYSQLETKGLITDHGSANC